MSLSVKKIDGQQEPYIHTRVMATISAAISDVGCYDEQTVNALADAVRMYIEDCRDENTHSAVVASDEIYAMVLATLEQTGLVRAAAALKHHRVTRQIKRSRQMILHCLKDHLPAEDKDEMLKSCCVNRKDYFICNEDSCPCFSLEPWNKSRLASSLKETYNMNAPAARALSGSIEAKIFNLDMSVVRSELIYQLILNEFYFIRKFDSFFENCQKHGKTALESTEDPIEIQEVKSKSTNNNYHSFQD